MINYLLCFPKILTTFRIMFQKFQFANEMKKVRLALLRKEGEQEKERAA